MSTNDIGRVWESYPDSKEAMEQFSLYHARDAHRVELARQAGQPDFDLFVQAPMTPPDEVNPVLGRPVEAAEWMNFRQVGTNPKSPFAKSPTPKFEMGQEVLFQGNLETKVFGIRMTIHYTSPNAFITEYLVQPYRGDMSWVGEPQLTAKEQR